MKMQILIAAAVAVSFAAPAAADEYYVIRDAKTKHCTVVTEKPESKTVVTQIGPIAFKSRDEAEARIKKTKVCTND